MTDFFIECTIRDVEYNEKNEIMFNVRHGGAVFHIRYSAPNLADSPSVLQEHQDLFTRLHDSDGESDEGWAERLGKPFEDLMTSLAPNSPMDNLYAYLYPPLFFLDATVDESGCIQPRLNEADTRENFRCPGQSQYRGFFSTYISPLLALKVSYYSSREVKVLTRTSRLIPCKVVSGGTVCFFKPWVSGQIYGYHELKAYGKILAASQASPPLLPNDVRICRLQGLVIDEDQDVIEEYHLRGDPEDPRGDQDRHCKRLVGLLLTYVENKGTMGELAPWSDCKVEDRWRWYRQICESVKSLHDADVVWGDAKPDNVLIGMDDNAYLVDFGGSHTPAWVDKDKRETKEGDWQGLRNIEAWLVDRTNNPIHRRVKWEDCAIQGSRTK